MLCYLVDISLRGLTKIWDENYEHAIILNFSFELTDVNQNTFINWYGSLA